MVQAHPLRALLAELRQHGQCVELALDYLSAAAVTAYLRQRFGGSPWAAALARVLHQRTSGNPLFLIAMVDELVRQQVVTEGPAGCFKGEVFYKHLIIIDFSTCLSCASPVSHAAFGMALTGTGTSSSNGGTTGQGSGTKRPCGMGS